MAEPTEAGWYWWRQPACPRWEAVRVALARDETLVMWRTYPERHYSVLETSGVDWEGGAVFTPMPVAVCPGTWGERIPDAPALSALIVAVLGMAHPRAAAEKWRFMAKQLHRLHPSCEFGDMCYAMSEAAALLPTAPYAERGTELAARKAAWGKCPHCGAPAWRSCSHGEGVGAHFWCLHCNQRWSKADGQAD